MGLRDAFRSSRDLNRMVDAFAELAGTSAQEAMRITGAIAQGSGRAVTRGEALAMMLATIRLLDQHGSATTAMHDFGERFDDGRLTTHDGKALYRTVPTELAVQLFVKTAHTYRPHLARR